VKNKKRSTHSLGVSLVELMTAVALISVVFLATVKTMVTMSQTILVSKYKTLATNLAQEKIEEIKSFPYYTVMTSSVSDTGIEGGSHEYYTGPTHPYGEDQVVVGAHKFTRRVLVDKVAKGAGDGLISFSWNVPDTGLKRIVVHVLWQNEAAEWERIELTNLRENPGRVFREIEISGHVDGSDQSDVEFVRVDVLQNISIFDVTDNSGNYSFNVAPGSYTIRASSKTYYTAYSQTVYVEEGDIVTIDFDGTDLGPMTRRGTGNIDGYVLKRDHLVISEIVADVAPPNSLDIEYIELYNPTTWPFTISLSDFKLKWIDASNTPNDIEFGIVNKDDPLNLPPLVSTTIPPNSYFTFLGSNDPATTFLIEGLIADATYFRVLPDNGESGVAIRNKSVLLDSVAWGGSGGGCDPPSLVLEGDGVIVGNCGSPGIGTGLSIERIAYINATEFDMKTQSDNYTDGINLINGNAWDSNDNAQDWVHHQVGTSTSPQNNSSIEIAIGGTPAGGAVLFSDDGLSEPLESDPDGTFELTNIATGTWIISTSSAGLYDESLMAIETGITLNQDIILDLSNEYGYISGEVRNVNGDIIPGILVGSGFARATTDSVGYYRLSVSPGGQRVGANPRVRGSYNANYTTEKYSPGFNVDLGELVPNIDLVLSEGGSLTGFVGIGSSDGLSAYPISVKDQGSLEERAYVVTEDDGHFEVNLSTGKYRVEAIPKLGEVVNPSFYEGIEVKKNYTKWIGSFTVTDAYATIRGSVTSGLDPIETGVMLLVIKDADAIAYPYNPPEIDNAMRIGSKSYYLASSQSDSTYEIQILGTGEPYSIYGWYTTYTSEGVPSTNAVKLPLGPVAPGALLKDQDINF